jgi:hypothetical protein
MGSEITDNLAKQVAPTDNKGFDAYQLLTEGRSLKSQTGSTNLHAVEINRDSAAAATGKAAGESAASSVAKPAEGESTSAAQPKSSESKAVSSCAGGKKGADGAATQSKSEAAQGSGGWAIPGEQQQHDRARQIPGGSVEKDLPLPAEKKTGNYEKDQPMPAEKKTGNYEKDQPMPVEKNPGNYEKGSADPSGVGNPLSGTTEKSHSIAVPDGQTTKSHSQDRMPGSSGGLKSQEPVQLPQNGTSFNKPYAGQPLR